ncbi:hypothetical protein T09_13857 [Trichinella sp. T9]|nr:hypothetical protein T09_13857 [Trichinella sp. T9]
MNYERKLPFLHLLFNEGQEEKGFNRIIICRAIPTLISYAYHHLLITSLLQTNNLCKDNAD